MSGKLSERFAQLKNSAPATGNRNVRIQKSAQEQKGNRAATTAARRGIAAVAGGNQPRKNSNATAKTNKSGNAAVRVRKTNVKGANAGGKKPTNNKNNGKNNRRRRNSNNGDKKGKPSQEDLDKEMDTYWFQAGKGPNPEVASLDNDLDSYFQNKSAEGATLTVTAPETA